MPRVQDCDSWALTRRFGLASTAVFQYHFRSGAFVRPAFRKKPPRAAFCISDPPFEAGFLLAQAKMKTVNWTLIIVALIHALKAIVVAAIHAHEAITVTQIQHLIH